MLVLDQSPHRSTCRPLYRRFHFPSRHLTLAAALALAAIAIAGPAPDSAQAKGVPTAVKLSAPSAATAGVGFKVTGRLLSRRSGAGLSGRSVQLSWQPAGSRDFIGFATVRSGAQGRFTDTVTVKTAGGGELQARFEGGRGLSKSRAITQAITVAAPAPAPAPAPVPAPAPTPAPGARVPPPDPLTTKAYPVASSNVGMVPGSQECLNGNINRFVPLIEGATGTWVYAIDKLFAKPTDGSANWQLAASGVMYYAGTHGPVYAWTNPQTGIAKGTIFDSLDDWTINSGWTATIVQYLWDEGVWYYQEEAACSF